MSQINTSKMNRKLGYIPMLATLLACSGSFGMTRDLEPVTPGNKRYDSLAPARPVIDASRMAEAVQTDGQVDDEFVAPAVLSETSVLTSQYSSYAGQAGELLGTSGYSAQLFVSNLVSSSRRLQYVSKEDVSFWELNERPQAIRPVVPGGLSSGSNLIV